MTHPVNLIPLHRRRAKARASRKRAWFAIGGSYTALLLVAGVALVMTAGPTNAPLRELAKATSDMERSNRQLLGIQATLAEAQQTLTAAHAVSDQPDWSIMLALLSESQGDEVVLNRCELTPSKDEPIVPPGGTMPPNAAAPLPPAPPSGVQNVSLPAKPATPARPVGRVVLSVGGIGRNQAAVATFVLQLESTELFEHVNLLQTSRQEYLGTEAVAFSLDCPLRGQTGGGGQ
jgi:Tfp pilus assembly protein PilN